MMRPERDQRLLRTDEYGDYVHYNGKLYYIRWFDDRAPQTRVVGVVYWGEESVLIMSVGTEQPLPLGRGNTKV